MTLAETFEDFMGAVANAATYAPDEYPEWSYASYDVHKTDIPNFWSQILPRIKKDVEQANFIDQKVKEAFSAFDQVGKRSGTSTTPSPSGCANTQTRR